MIYLKSIKEFFYFDGGPGYGGAKDPSKPKSSDLANKEYIYSNINSKYYTLDDLEDLQNKYFQKYQKQFHIKTTQDLDYILNLVNPK